MEVQLHISTKVNGGSWSSASGSSVQLTGLSANTYNIRIRDAGDCTSGGEDGVALAADTGSSTPTQNIEVIVSEPDEEFKLSPTKTITNPECSGDIQVLGSIEINIEGGVRTS